MNVTKKDNKDRKLHNEDYLQMVSAEQKEYAEVSAHSRITENNLIITDLQTDNLLKWILTPDNLNQAYKKVKRNKGAGGVDGMSVDGLLPFLREHQLQLVQKIRDGKYKPNPVRRVEIPKEEKGKVRELGIPTVVDWVNYFKLADMKSPLKEIDAWLRSRIRLVLRKQWKKIKTRFANLKRLGWIIVNRVDTKKEIRI